MNRQDISKKVEEYEQFIEEKLKVDLRDIETAINLKLSKYKDWEDVKDVVKIVDEFKEKDRDMLVRLNSDNGILLNGEVTDFENTYISIGLGYILEMDCEEARKYSDIRLRLLKKEIDHLRKLAVDVKVHIKLVLLAINELKTPYNKR